MKKEDIVIKSTKQGIVVALDSSLDFKELLAELRIRLKDSKVEDLTSEGQVIVDLGSRDVLQVEMSTLESLFFEHGLFLKRIMSRPKLPVEKFKSGATGSKGKTKSKSSKISKDLVKGKAASQSGTSAAEVIQIKDLPAKANSIHHLTELVKEVPGLSNSQEQPEIASLNANKEVAVTVELEARSEPLSEKRVIKKNGNIPIEGQMDDQHSSTKVSEEEARGVFKNTFDQPDTLLVQRSLRSGQSIQHTGSVVIMGDVNPGAEVTAGGNIVVMGSFRGVAHAGARGDESATITAFRLRPTQLRIAGHITRPPDDEQAAPEVTEIARVREGIVVIERY